jgi:DNA-directed RNA polymerase subunit F
LHCIWRETAKATTEQTKRMKEKSSKTKKDKPAVQIKDLKPTKDAQGQSRLMFAEDRRMLSRDTIRLPGGLPRR